MARLHSQAPVGQWRRVFFGTLLLLTVLPAHAVQGLPDFTGLVKRNHAAVVNISFIPADAGQSSEDDERSSPLDEQIERFRDRQQEPEFFERDAQGSGFIISGDGYILTNNHVVEGAGQVMVSLHDRRQLKAAIIGVDSRSDIALLKIEATDLPVVTIGNSDELEVGEWVLAIGSPFGFDFSVTAGIVSAIGRALPSESYVPFIQTDVAINPGNSGGPLFNLAGDVIGINSQIYSRTGAFMGLSFAIPIELAMDVADQLRDTGQVSRGWLGVIIQEVTRDLASSMDMPVAHGALISNILPDSPAANSTLQVGDVITHFNGNRVERSVNLPPLVGRVPAGKRAELNVMRQGKAVKLKVRIGELPADGRLVAAERPRETLDSTSIVDRMLGLVLAPVSERQRRALGIDQGGVLVDRVLVGGPGENGGVRPGDIMLMIDNVSIDSVSEAAEVLESLRPDSPIAVLLQRASGPVFIAIDPGS